MADFTLTTSPLDARGPAEHSSGTVDWLRDNVYHPFGNALLVEPKNALANIVNEGAHLVGHKQDVMSKASVAPVPDAPFLSGQWLAQSVSGCVGMILPYAIAGKVAGVGLRTVGERFAVEDKMAVSALASEHTAQILGAATYSFAQDPGRGQTRWGNAFGTAVGFGVFEFGGALSQGVSTIGGKTAVRALTGVVGGTSQDLVSSFTATGHSPDMPQLTKAAISGALMNSVLPLAQEGLQRGIDATNNATGRGVSANRYAQSKFGFTAAREPSAMHPIDRAANYFTRQSSVDVSPALSSLIGDAPWLRVQETADQSAYIASRDRVLLGPSGRNPEGLAHELEHREQSVSGSATADFDDARKLLKDGDVQAAQESFLAARLKQEAGAIDKGAVVAKDFGQAPTGAGQADIANMRLHDGRTYAQLWQDEFRQFAASNGQIEPDINYAPARKALLANPQYWQALLNRWDNLSQKDKLNSLRELQRAPEKSRLQVFTQAMLKPGEDMSVEHETNRKSLIWSVREIADSQFKSLAPADRIKAFNQMLKSDDYHVRTLAISHIGDLPARARTEAFYNVLQHSRALIIPDTGRRSIFDSLDDEEKPPLFPGWDNSALTPVFKNSPARLLMESIADLPASDRQRAWMSAYEYSRVGKTRYGGTGTLHPARQAAIGAFDVLPDGSRPAMWNRAWNDVSSSHKNILVEQIASLPESARLDAFNKVFAGPQSMKGESVGKAISSLAVSDRLPSWQKLFARSRKDWTSTPEFREEAAIAGIAPDTAYVDPFASSPYGSTRYDTAYNRRRSASIVSDTSSVDRGLARSIESLPAVERAQAWSQVLKLDPGRYANELAHVIPRLPAPAQMNALRALLELAGQDAEKQTGEPQPSGYGRFEHRSSQKGSVDPATLRAAMSKLPLEAWPDVVETIQGSTSGKLRIDMLAGFEWWRTDLKTPVEERSDNAARMFETAQRHLEPGDYQALASWWAKLHYLEPRDESQDILPTPVRDALLNRMDPVLLGRILISHSDSTGMDAMAVEHPEVIRTIAQKFWGDDLANPEEVSEEEGRLAEVMNLWNEHRRLDVAAAKAAAPIDKPKDKWGHEGHVDYEVFPPLIASLARLTDSAGRVETLSKLREMTSNVDLEKAKRGGDNNNLSLRLPLRTAAAIGSVEPQAFDTHFMEPLQAELTDRTRNFNWRLSTAREVAALQREGELSQSAFVMPDLRMPKKVIPEADKTMLRSQLESGIRDEATMRSLMGDGALGQLLPEIFGEYDTGGGIVGRPQHGGHEFLLDDHTMLVMKRIREHPDFGELSPKDQDNLLLAALLHDSGKRANVSDPDHEMAGSNLAWGVLGTLGYSPVRIQRVANLVARHSDMSYRPGILTSERLQDPATLDNIATFYRHPSALTQLRIFNESDIKSINSTSSLWTGNVEAELDRIHALVQRRVQELNTGLVPILTTAVPSGFGIILMSQPYAFLAHVTPHLDASFLKQLSLIESPEYSISSSLITPQHHEFYYGGQPTFALVAGPWEQIAQSYRENLGTGTSVDWKAHVQLSKEWLESDRAISFAREIDGIARTARMGRMGAGLGYLESARQSLAQFDSLDELLSNGRRQANNPLVATQLGIHRALTTDITGGALKKHNEIKLNSPTVVGLGVLRANKPVFFENLSDPSLISGNSARPAWFLHGSSAEAPPGAVVIKEQTWKTLQDRDLPIVVLDP